MSGLGFLVVASLCAGLGWSLLGLVADEDEAACGRAVTAFVAGMLGLHLWLTLLQALGVRWTPWTIAAIALPALAVWRFLPRPVPPPRERRLGWPDVLPVLAISIFAFAVFQLWILFPDVIFHWGIKGQRYALAGGVDWTFLARPWNWRSHPDYSNLLPELYAASAIFGGWRERAVMAWSVLFFALVVLAAREGLARCGVADRPRQLATAALAALVAAFAIANILGGSADWLPALALLVAWPALVAPPSPKGDLRVSLAAALAAASKIEGVPLMAFLVATSLLRRLLWRRGLDWRALLRTAALPGLVGGLWWLGCRRHGLFQPFDTGALDLSRWSEVVPALASVMFSWGAWGTPLLLLAVPFLLFTRGQRGLAVVVGAQLAFCLYIYMSAPVDPAFSVKSSFARLIFHLWPAVAMSCVAISERLVRRIESCDPSAP